MVATGYHMAFTTVKICFKCNNWEARYGFAVYLCHKKNSVSVRVQEWVSVCMGQMRSTTKYVGLLLGDPIER